MAEPRTVSIPVDGSKSVEAWTLPPSLQQYIQAVYVEVNNGSGVAVSPLLTISEQSGVVIAKKRQADSIPAAGTGSATWALRLTDEASSNGLHWGVNTDSFSQGLTLNGAGAFLFKTGGSSFSTTTSGGSYSVATTNGGISFDTSAPGTFDVAVHNSDFNLHSDHATIGTSGSGTTAVVSGVNVSVGASGGITIECTGGDVFINSKASGKTILRSQAQIVIQDGGGNPILALS